MITKWKLRNFKSIKESTELTFGPLTILAGANSSGKSTVIQSILLISQTLLSRVSTRSVVLNGPLTKLGQFDDLRTYGSDEEQIHIGWEIGPFDKNVFKNSELEEEQYSIFWREINRIICELSFDANNQEGSDNIDQLRPRLFSNYIKWTEIDELENEPHEIYITRALDKNEKIKSNHYEGEIPAPHLLALDYDINIDNRFIRSLGGYLLSPKPLGVQLQHFLPSSILIQFNRNERIAKIIETQTFGRDEYSYAHDKRYLRTHPELLELEIPKKIEECVSQHLNRTQTQNLQETSTGTIKLSELLSKFEYLYQNPRGKLRINNKNNYDLRKTILDILNEKMGENYGFIFYQLANTLEDVSTSLVDYFSNYIKYLGPLRDEPRPLYPLAASNDPFDIGIKGEHTAAIFDLYKNKTITYIAPDIFKKSSVTPALTKQPLKVAIMDWLKYLDVADGIETQDLGKIGHELKVKTKDLQKDQDLTHVGVGVSQVLPILVMCLLADPDSTIIIEQPELHLHPKVQSLLADFFLSIALIGIQCVIETHSEYILNRLRFRAAAAEKENISSIMKIYFVEKKEGKSSFRPVEVNKYGAITDWPEGFFDQSQSEAEEILRAASLKRKAERG